MSESERVSEMRPHVKKNARTSRIQKLDSSKNFNSFADCIMFLQRTVGNQGVKRMIRSGTLQAKLKIGQPEDKYEQEADRVADQVMRMPEPQEVSGNNLHIQRACPKCEENELKRQPAEDEREEKLQSKTASDFNPELNPGIENQLNSIRGGGSQLSEGERAFFEPRFNADFSQVRVHTDAKAAEVARGVNARAFTMGKDVVFGEGHYAQGTGDGRKLLGHELTHVIQQQGRILKDGNNLQRLGEDIPFAGPLSQFTSPTTIIGSILGRPLNGREIGVLVPVFGPYLNYFAMRICEAGICSPDSIPRTIGNIIGTPRGFDDNTLIHESAHVWQHQNGVPFGYAVDALTAQLVSWLVTGSRLGAYNYTLLERWRIPWRFWNAEQQASWIQDNRRLPSFLVWGVGRGMLPP